jgi:ADP-ribose pyrophosphatase YjhB (NUDIX family)
MMSFLTRLNGPFVRRLMHFYWRFARGMTLGVRAIVIDPQGRVFLVKHSYVEGWHLPGGGVEWRETLQDALGRELLEEGNITLRSAPILHGFYFNATASVRDHVALFIVRDFEQRQAPIPDREILEHGFFSADALPSDTTAGTRRRIREVFQNEPVSERW